MVKYSVCLLFFGKFDNTVVHKINQHLHCIQEAIDSVKTLTDEETDEAANTVPSVAGSVYRTSVLKRVIKCIFVVQNVSRSDLTIFS
jgi:hypothetical protein